MLHYWHYWFRISFELNLNMTISPVTCRVGLKLDRVASVAVTVLSLQRPVQPDAVTACLDIMAALAQESQGRKAILDVPASMEVLCRHLKGVVKASSGIPRGGGAILAVFLGLASDVTSPDAKSLVRSRAELRSLLLRRPSLRLVGRTLSVACELCADPDSLKPMHTTGCIAALVLILNSLSQRYLITPGSSAMLQLPSAISRIFCGNVQYIEPALIY
jgi:hypothetical protein